MSVQEEKLKAIANAIREKEDSEALIPAEEFPERIRGIESSWMLSTVKYADKSGTIKADLSDANMGSYGTITVTVTQINSAEYHDFLILFPDYKNAPKYGASVNNCYAVTAILVFPMVLASGPQYRCYFLGNRNNSSYIDTLFGVTVDRAGDVWTITIPAPTSFGPRIPTNIETFQCAAFDVFKNKT